MMFIGQQTIKQTIPVIISNRSYKNYENTDKRLK